MGAGRHCCQLVSWCLGGVGGPCRQTARSELNEVQGCHLESFTLLCMQYLSCNTFVCVCVLSVGCSFTCFFFSMDHYVHLNATSVCQYRMAGVCQPPHTEVYC